MQNRADTGFDLRVGAGGHSGSTFLTGLVGSTRPTTARTSSCLDRGVVWAVLGPEPAAVPGAAGAARGGGCWPGRTGTAITSGWRRVATTAAGNDNRPNYNCRVGIPGSGRNCPQPRQSANACELEGRRDPELSDDLFVEVWANAGRSADAGLLPSHGLPTGKFFVDGLPA